MVARDTVKSPALIVIGDVALRPDAPMRDSGRWRPRTLKILTGNDLAVGCL